MAKKTGGQLVAYAKSMLGHPYWYGTYGLRPTKAMLEAKTRQYPGHYTAARREGYLKDISEGKTVTDCYGLIKGFGWQDSAGRIVYGAGGVKDTNANGIYAAATVKGAIKTMPELPGLAVHRDGHIGVYIGGGEVIEARGRAYGVVRTKLKDRDFVHWLRLPFIDYSGAEAGTGGSGALGERALCRGDKGNDVRTLQGLLNKTGADLKVDGEYGPLTEAAVKRYQREAGLKETGVAEEGTIKRLMSDAAGDDMEDGSFHEGGGSSGEGISGGAGAVVITGGSVYVRTGPGTQYEATGIARVGDRLSALAGDDGQRLAVGGWYAVTLGGKVCWVSGKYAG